MTTRHLSRYLLLSLLGSSLALTGCAGAAEEDAPSLAAASEASMTEPPPVPPPIGPRLISTNGLASDYLEASDVLDMLNQLKGTGLSAPGAIDTEHLDSTRKQQTMAYLVRCALSDGVLEIGSSRGGGSYTFAGHLGLADHWREEPLTAAGQRLVSACLLAHVNSLAKPVAISVRMPAHPASPEEEQAFPAEEAAYFGNLFVDASGGESPRLLACTGASSSLAAQQSGRVCGVTDACHFDIVGSCSAVCARSDGSYTDCVGHSVPYAEVVTVYTAAPSDYRFTRAPFNDTTTAWSGGDWDAGHGEASCAVGDTLTGISVAPGGQARTALCRHGGAGGFSGEVVATLATGGDRRRAVRAGSWGEGYWKLECGFGEYVSAVSEDTSQVAGDNRFHAVQCARGQGLGNACTERVFDASDNRGTALSGEWDFGANKGECAASEYVAGVSVSPQTGAPHSLLCCGASSVGPTIPIDPDPIQPQ